ncbi:MAG: hypothetical protein D4R93_02635 [Deltaproteobacteria bacterium]|nr:MAG: hypothetical protein D4R93_02635 [Deltaproteobacteria bacterium]
MKTPDGDNGCRAGKSRLSTIVCQAKSGCHIFVDKSPGKGYENTEKGSRNHFDMNMRDASRRILVMGGIIIRPAYTGLDGR